MSNSLETSGQHTAKIAEQSLCDVPLLVRGALRPLPRFSLLWLDVVSGRSEVALGNLGDDALEECVDCGSAGSMRIVGGCVGAGRIASGFPEAASSSGAFLWWMQCSVPSIRQAEVSTIYVQEPFDYHSCVGEPLHRGFACRRAESLLSSDSSARGARTSDRERSRRTPAVLHLPRPNQSSRLIDCSQEGDRTGTTFAYKASPVVRPR